MHIIETAKEHPVAVGVAAFVIGFLALKFLGVFGGSTDNSGAAYASAVASDNASANALQLATVTTTAQTAQTQIAADAYTTTQTKWADTQLAELNATNDNNLALAPFALQAGVVSGLTSVAALPPTTSQKTSNGIFGLFGSSKTVTTPNPNAQSASDALEALLHTWIGAQA